VRPYQKNKLKKQKDCGMAEAQGSEFSPQSVPPGMEQWEGGIDLGFFFFFFFNQTYAKDMPFLPSRPPASSNESLLNLTHWLS
jgi:hypothetical protein